MCQILVMEPHLCRLIVGGSFRPGGRDILEKVLVNANYIFVASIPIFPRCEEEM